MRISDWSSDVCSSDLKGGRNGIGPNLHGIVGRAVAAHDGFSYSGAMKAKGGVWDEAALDAYLADPMKTVPGTRMAFAGVIDPADRKADRKSTRLNSSH